MFKKIKIFRRTILGRLRYFRLSGCRGKIRVGRRFFCGKHCHYNPKNVINIGDDFYMGNYCHFVANADIGDSVLFASCVALVGGDHKFDFRSLKGYGWPSFRKMNLMRMCQDKGQKNCTAAFIEAIRNGTPAPILLLSWWRSVG